MNIVLLLGLCQGSLFDTKYSWTGSLRNGHFTFHGHRGSFLQYDSDIMAWKLSLHATNHTYAITRTEYEDYPFGNHNWHIVNDACSDLEANNGAVLSLSGCSDSEFNCRDGTCISMEMRCDDRLNCPDSSGKTE